MHNKPGYSMNFDLRSRRDNPAKNELIKRLRLSPEETLSMLTRNSDEYIEGMRRFVKNFFRPPTDRLFNCGAGHIVSVDAYGNAQMCNLLRHPSTIYSLDPNLHQENHPDSGFSPLVFAFKDFFPQIRQIRANNPEYLRRCAICFLRSLCEQCPAKSWEEHGTLDTPVEYHCQVTHAQARYLGLIDEGEKSWDVPKADWRARLDQFANQV